MTTSRPHLGHVPQGVQHEVGRDVVGQVGGEDPLVLTELVPPLAIRRIRVQDADAIQARHRFLERGDERWIHLDGEYVGAGLGERSRERAEAGADLDDVIARTDAGIGRDRASEVRIDQEMLSERSLRPDAVPVGERTQRARAERSRSFFATHGRSVAR